MHCCVGNNRALQAGIRRLAPLAALLLALHWPITAFADSSLDLAEAQRLAVSRSSQLVAQDAATTAAREMAVAAAQLPDPVASLDINNLPVNGEDAWSLTRDFMTMRSVGVMQEFTRTRKASGACGALRARRPRNRGPKRSPRSRRSSATRALAWLDRYYAEAMATVVSEQSRQATRRGRGRRRRISRRAGQPGRHPGRPFAPCSAGSTIVRARSASR